MRKSSGFIFLFVALLVACASAPGLAGASAAATASQQSDIYTGWLKMYDLKFDEAHGTFGEWQQSHPDDSLGAASNAAAYL